MITTLLTFLLHLKLVSTSSFFGAVQCRICESLGKTAVDVVSLSFNMLSESQTSSNGRVQIINYIVINATCPYLPGMGPP